MDAEKSVITNIVKRSGGTVPYDRSLIAIAIYKAVVASGGNDREMAEDLSKEVEQVLIDAYLPDATPTVEDIQDVVESVLIKNTLVDVARKYITYRAERAKAREQRDPVDAFVDNIPYKLLYQAYRWNEEYKCHTVAGLNKHIADATYPELVQYCTRRYNEEVAAGADRILARLPNVRVVIVAGPSSSGKTTTTFKISEALKREGKKFKALAVDHYFFDLEQHPKDEFGDYDYETPNALDLPLINQHLKDLLEGKPIVTPNYDFKTGKRTLNVHEMSLAEDEILLIDCLHGLYSDITEGIDKGRIFKLYIETLGQLRNAEGTMMRWADNRLMRRMIRDSWSRNLQPEQTLTHWHYVRRSELENIIPYIGTVDYIVNSALPYELPLLKNRLFRFFPEAMALYENEPKRRDAYIRAKRIYEFLTPLTAVEDDSPVPPDALLREFIGGSQYDY